MKITVYFLNGNSIDTLIICEDRLYRNDVIVEIDEIFYEVHFYDWSVLRYHMRIDGFTSFPGLIIVDDLTVESILRTVERLADTGYFRAFTGYTSLPDTERFFDRHWCYTSPVDEERMAVIKVRE